MCVHVRTQNLSLRLFTRTGKGYSRRGSRLRSPPSIRASPVLNKASFEALRMKQHAANVHLNHLVSIDLPLTQASMSEAPIGHLACPRGSRDIVEPTLVLLRAFQELWSRSQSHRRQCTDSWSRLWNGGLLANWSHASLELVFLSVEVVLAHSSGSGRF